MVRELEDDTKSQLDMNDDMYPPAEEFDLKQATSLVLPRRVCKPKHHQNHSYVQYALAILVIETLYTAISLKPYNKAL